MPLMLDQIDDFVELTLNKFKRRSWVDISLDLQHLHFAGRMATMKKMAEANGPKLEWKVQVSDLGTSRWTGLFDVDQTSVKNLMVSAEVPFCLATTNFSYDLNENAFQGGPEQIIDMLKVREHSMYTNFFKLMETAMWTAPSGPVSSASDTREPFGIPYWLVQSTSEGFNGTNPAGFTSGAGGINSTTYPNWANWTFGYSAVSRGDAIDKLLTAMDKTYFQAPHNFSELGGGTPDWCLYTVYSFLADVRRELQASNDNLGNDIGAYSGNVLVRGVPLKWAPALDTTSSPGYDANDPIYGINWKVFRWVFNRGRNMVRHAPEKAPNQHNVRVVHMDTAGQFQCDNRRAMFVGRKS